MAARMNGNSIAFVVMAFVICGLAGVFATYALSVSLQRALSHEAVMDEALAAARGPDPAAAIAALAPRLGESAAAIDADTGPFEARIQRERAAMRTRVLAETAETALRLRWLIMMVSLMGAVFVIAIVGSPARPAEHPAPRT